MKNNRYRTWLWGTYFLLAAVLVIASQFGSFAQVGFWTLLATVLLVALFIQSILDMQAFGMLISLAVLYMIYQKPLHFHYINPWLLLLAAALAGIGLNILLHPRCKWKKVKQVHNGTVRPPMKAEEGGDDNHPYARVSFNQADRHLTADNLEEGQFSASFGQLQVYCNQVSLSPNGANLYLECSFGNMILYLPAGWRVVDQISTAFGSVKMGSRAAQPEGDAPQVTLHGSVHFGEIEVRFVE
nr:hypothetical protein [bacterium]